MFLPLLTVAICLTAALEFQVFQETTKKPHYENVEPYNIYDYVKDLQLEQCSLVAVGLKYFAIFVEDGVVNITESNITNKYFLGICHQTTLENWSFCTPDLTKKKHKCKFKLRSNQFQDRVHRRFCDIKVMVNNNDCLCENTIFGDFMFKVKGFPTCFIPPLPESLCKYNVCGLSKCRASSVEKRVHTVQCDPECRGGKPFCEHPLSISAFTPITKSSWSKWSLVATNESLADKKPQRSLASCINSDSGTGDIDCLGPSTGCCSGNLENCACRTFEENGVLRVEKIVESTSSTTTENQIKTTELPKITPPPPPIKTRRAVSEHPPLRHSLRPSRLLRHTYRYLKDSDEDIEDDDEDDQRDVEEDIVLEEDMADRKTDISPISTTEELERDEIKGTIKNDSMKDFNLTSNVTTEKMAKKSRGISLEINYIVASIMLSVIILTVNFS